MSEIYYVEVEKAPEQDKRFATFFGHEFVGLDSIQMVPFTRVVYKNAAGDLAGDKPLSWCMKIVDVLQDAVKRGSPQKWLASGRVIKFHPATSARQVVYIGKVEEAKHIEPEVPKCFLAFDGTYRKTPTTGIQKGPRAWAFSIAFVDSSNVPRSDRFNGETRLATIAKLFESDIPWHQEYVRTLPLAEPADIPAPPEPVVERIFTQAELDAVTPLSVREWNLLPSAEHSRRYAFDPLYRAAFKKMLDLEEQRKQRESEQNAKAAEEKELQKIREGFLKHDADEARKGGIGSLV